MGKILIVEDDPLMLRMYQRIFALENFTVETAENGQEALDKVAVSKPALILMDIMMPKMNGMQALDALKANPNTREIPVIMLTNLAGQLDAEEALNKGAAKYVIKSEYEPKQIAEMVKNMLPAGTFSSDNNTQPVTPQANSKNESIATAPIPTPEVKEENQPMS